MDIEFLIFKKVILKKLRICLENKNNKIPEKLQYFILKMEAQSIEKRKEEKQKFIFKTLIKKMMNVYALKKNCEMKQPRNLSTHIIFVNFEIAVLKPLIINF